LSVVVSALVTVTVNNCVFDNNSFIIVIDRNTSKNYDVMKAAFNIQTYYGTAL